MLSLFPEILFLAPVSIFLFRVALALTLTYSAWRHFSSEADTGTRAFGALEIAFSEAQAAQLEAASAIAPIFPARFIGRPMAQQLIFGTSALQRRP